MDPLSTLVRTYGSRPPYDAVNWNAMQARILAGSDEELDRRRTAIARGRAGALRQRVGGWWEVTAGWARPAVAAAVAMIAVASALVVATPASSTNVGGNDGLTPAEVTASSDGVDAVMLGSESNATAIAESRPISRDSLFSTLVDER
jgi:hypothetical protein